MNTDCLNRLTDRPFTTAITSGGMEEVFANVSLSLTSHPVKRFSTTKGHPVLTNLKKIKAPGFYMGGSPCVTIPEFLLPNIKILNSSKIIPNVSKVFQMFPKLLSPSIPLLLTVIYTFSILHDTSLY